MSTDDDSLPDIESELGETVMFAPRRASFTAEPLRSYYTHSVEFSSREPGVSVRLGEDSMLRMPMPPTPSDIPYDWLGADGMASTAKLADSPASLAANHEQVMGGLRSLIQFTAEEWNGSSKLLEVGRSGGIKLALTVLMSASAVPADLDTESMETSLLFLRQLTRTDANGEATVAQDGIGPVVNALRLTPTLVKIQEHGVACLGNMASQEECCRMIAESRGIDAVIAALKNHVDDADVQECCCVSMRALASRDANVPYMLMARAPEGMSAGVLAHPSAASLARRASTLFLTLAQWRSSSGLLRSAVETLANQGAIQALVQVLQLHSNNEDVATTASQALHIMADDDRGFAALRTTADIVPQLSTVLHARPELGPLQAELGTVFTRLVMDLPVTEAMMEEVAASGCTEAVIAVMRDNTMAAVVQLWGCQHLMALGYHGSRRPRVGRQEGIQAIVEAMRVHDTHEGIQEAALGALWVLCFHPDNRTALGSIEGATGLVLGSQRTYSENPRVQERVAALVFLLK